jgi:hypothetical protein
MKRAFFITAALLAVTATSFSAHAASLKSNLTAPGKLGFAAPGGGSTHGHTETCNNIASCNLMISYCAEHGGDWSETGTPGPKGQPQKGQCTYP